MAKGNGRLKNWPVYVWAAKVNINHKDTSCEPVRLRWSKVEGCYMNKSLTAAEPNNLEVWPDGSLVFSSRSRKEVNSWISGGWAMRRVVREFLHSVNV